MTPSSQVPALDYDRLRESLADAGAVIALPELHGGVCGALCAGGVPAARRWLDGCLDDQELAAPTATAVTGDLEELLEASEKTLADPDLTFEPLLPGDDAPLDEQVQALALWCQGFLNGLGTTAPSAARQSDGGSLAEIMSDFAEISRAGLSEEEAAGQAQADFALAEIHEYVRVSVAVAFEELAAARSAATRDLH